MLLPIFWTNILPQSCDVTCFSEIPVNIYRTTQHQISFLQAVCFKGSKHTHRRGLFKMVLCSKPFLHVSCFQHLFYTPSPLQLSSLCLFSTMYCSLLRLIVRSGLDIPTFATRHLHACHHARAPSGGRWNCGREMPGKFCLNADLHVTFRDLLHAVKLRHGTFRRKEC